ncbi:MAG TPA: 1-acyl-sn-glycerol-3-phosphate acyltransferase [Chitinophagaceae bacterium]|nr:1-acyl-sn-glycerol-3-phosphate acyltransferase [Chitinophagaceae bacterium]
MVKNILARILAIWAMIVFIITFLIVFIPSMLCWLLPEPKGQAIFIGIARLWMNVWLRLVGCPLKVKGREHFRKGEVYIVTCNHNSMMDVPLSCPYIPGANKTIAKSTFTKVPLFGFYYMKGAVLVNRKDDTSRRRSYEKMKAVLRNGMHMSVYPEGTRNRSNEPLKKFHDGAFRLATETGTAIIPAVIFNTKKVLPTNKTFWFWPSKLEMHFLSPIEAKGKTSEALKNEVFEVMKAHYIQFSYSPQRT